MSFAFMNCEGLHCNAQLKLDHVERSEVKFAGTPLIHERNWVALEGAANALEWSRITNTHGQRQHFCPACSRDTVCARCLFKDCSCMGGRRFDRVRGQEDLE